MALGGFPILVSKLGWSGGTDVFGDAFAALPVSSATFIYVFLPLLVFEAGIATDVRRVIEDAAPILLLAIIATLVTTAVIGLALWPLAGVPLVVCLLLGAVVATTDPAAVIAIFRDVGAPGRLTRLVEGEALLNDAAAIALFAVLLGMIVAAREPNIGSGLSEFFLSFVGGGLLGLVAGRALLWVIPWVGEDRLAEGTLTPGARLRCLHRRRPPVSRIGRRRGARVGAYGQRSRPFPDCPEQLVVPGRSMGPDCVLGALFGLCSGVDPGAEAAWPYRFARFGLARGASGGGFRGPHPRAVRADAAARVSQADPADQRRIQARHSMGRIARRADPGSGVGGYREQRARSADPTLCCGARHRVRIVHAVRQRHDIAAGHRSPRTRPSFAAKRGLARPHSRACRTTRSAMRCAGWRKPMRCHPQPSSRSSNPIGLGLQRRTPATRRND